MQQDASAVMRTIDNRRRHQTEYELNNALAMFDWPRIPVQDSHLTPGVVSTPDLGNITQIMIGEHTGDVIAAPSGLSTMSQVQAIVNQHCGRQMTIREARIPVKVPNLLVVSIVE
jgi:hypothetical protein